MNKIWTILLVAFFFIGKAEAKLGQTLDEIKKGLNNRELVQEDEKTFPNDIIKFIAKNVREETGGFDFVRYSFFKDQEKRGNKCIRVNYHKIYEKMNDIPLLKKFEWIISENLGENVSLWPNLKTNGFLEEKNKPDEILSWQGPNGENAFAFIFKRDEDRMYSLSITCTSSEYSEFQDEMEYKNKSFLGKMTYIPSDSMMKRYHSNVSAGIFSRYYGVYERVVLIIGMGSVLGGWLFALGAKLRKKWLKISAIIYFIFGLIAATFIARNISIHIEFLANELQKNSEISSKLKNYKSATNPQQNP